MTLTTAQLRFLRLHARHSVTQWTWHFVATQLRARSERHTAYIWRDELDALVTLGLMTWGQGCADVRITDTGKEAAAAEEKEKVT